MMNWKSLDQKLTSGLTLESRLRTEKKTRFASPRSRIIYNSAKRTGQLGEGEIVQQLQSGSLIPDQLAGWSTKTILAALVAMFLVRGR